MGEKEPIRGCGGAHGCRSGSSHPSYLSVGLGLMMDDGPSSWVSPNADDPPPSSSAMAIGSDRNAILRRLVIKGIPGRGYRVVGGRANRTRISAELQSVFR